MDMLYDTITVFIQRGLQRWIEVFEERKQLLSFDIKEVELVKSFYDLHPEKEHVTKHSSRILY